MLSYGFFAAAFSASAIAFLNSSTAGTSCGVEGVLWPCIAMRVGCRAGRLTLTFIDGERVVLQHQSRFEKASCVLEGA